MKRFLPIFTFLLFSGYSLLAQENLAPEQNPNYEQSRSKYMGLADSLLREHGTTLQNTYKAIDFMADRAEARAERRSWRRNLRMERARWVTYPNYRYYPRYRYNWMRWNW